MASNTRTHTLPDVNMAARYPTPNILPAPSQNESRARGLSLRMFGIPTMS